MSTQETNNTQQIVRQLIIAAEAQNIYRELYAEYETLLLRQVPADDPLFNVYMAATNSIDFDQAQTGIPGPGQITDSIGRFLGVTT